MRRSTREPDADDAAIPRNQVEGRRRYALDVPVGDFYELFFEDAVIASQALDITLTGRDAGEAGRVPMCGVPHHALDGYLERLIEQGFRVAICDQVEDPKAAKGLVRPRLSASSRRARR